MMPGVDGLCKRVNVVRPKEFMLNKEGYKDMRTARTVKRSKGLMDFRSQLSQRIVAAGLLEGGVGKLKCITLRVG